MTYQEELSNITSRLENDEINNSFELLQLSQRREELIIINEFEKQKPKLLERVKSFTLVVSDKIIITFNLNWLSIGAYFNVKEDKFTELFYFCGEDVKYIKL